MGIVAADCVGLGTNFGVGSDADEEAVTRSAEIIVGVGPTVSTVSLVVIGVEAVDPEVGSSSALSQAERVILTNTSSNTLRFADLGVINIINNIKWLSPFFSTGETSVSVRCMSS